MKAWVRVLPAVIVMICFCARIEARAEDDWKLFKDDDGIKSYIRDDAEHKVKEIKATAIIKTRVGVLKAVTDDAVSYLDWYPDTVECRHIIKKGDVMYMYMVINSPLLVVKHKDIVFKVETETNYRTGLYRGYITGLPLEESFTYVPENPKYVRMPYLKAMMEGQAIDGETCVASYVQSVDVGGAIPKVFANIFSNVFPHKAMIGMRNIVQNQEWIDKGLTSEDGQRYQKYFYSQLNQ